MTTNYEEDSLLGVENETDLKAVIKKRFSEDKTHSYIDDVLLSINPCKTLSLAEHEKEQQIFQQVAILSINHLRCHHKNQCIVLTGDSGSGKTKLSNQLISFITKETAHTDHDLAKYIIQAGKVLESFGNASTLTSDNASRFIKLTELFLTQDVKLEGVHFHHYLLEKSRVVRHEKGERNFHIFYKFLGGTTEETLQNYHLVPGAYHRCIGSDFDWSEEQNEYEEDLMDTTDCLKSLGFNDEDVHTIFRILAAIVHICDLSVTTDSKRKTVHIGDTQTFLKASSLLKVSPERLQFSLLTEMTSVKGRIVRRVRNLNEVGYARDMLAMSLYSRLFAWIVWNINRFLAPIDAANSSGNTLSILDPFGFERLNVNSTEQLAINTTNEHLKFLYNQIVFAWEMEDQQAEGVLIQKIHFPDNKLTIDFLMERPDGIFAMVEQETKSLKGSDVSLVKKFSSKHRKHSCYSDVANSPIPVFTINHYAGPVTYSAVEILTRNKDMLGGSLITCLQESEDDLIYRLFMVRLSSTGAIERSSYQSPQEIPSMPRKAEMKKMQPTIRRHAEMIGNIHGITKKKVAKKQLVLEQAHLTFTSQFRNSLSDLMQRNLKSEVHFVVCIRPNQHLEPDCFDDDLVTSQLKYSGIMETVIMRQQGFPVRIAFGAFINRYKILSYPLTVDVKYSADTCEKILSTIDGLGWRIGKTKVFIKNSCMDQIDDLLDRTIRGIIILQKLYRAKRARRYFKFLKYERQKEKEQVAAFLSQFHSRIDNVYNHLCNQVIEEDARVKCSQSIQPGEEVKEKALQILEGLKPRKQTLNSTSKERASTPVTRPDTVDGQSNSQSDLQEMESSVNVSCDSNGDPRTDNYRNENLNLAEPSSEYVEPLITITDIFGFSPDVPRTVSETLTCPSRSAHDDTFHSAEYISISEDFSISDVFSFNRPTVSSEQSNEDDQDTSAEISITDIMMGTGSDDIATPLDTSIDSMTSPVRPSMTGKESNLSTFSFDSILSPDADIDDVAMDTPGVWCSITCYERDISRGEFQVDRPIIIVDGSSNAFDVTRIGIGSLPMNPSDEKVEKTRRCIGKGIKLTVDVEGNMWVKRCSKNNVYVKGCFLSEEVKESRGELQKGKLIKVFDFDEFSNNLQYECDPMRYEPGKGEALLSSCLVYFSFVKDAIEDIDIPCWIEVTMAEPYRITQIALDLAKDRRRIEREKRGQRTPPILRAKIGKSRKTIAVGAFEKQVRPKHYIDSFKYGRKGWARKKVSVNPFSYGNQSTITVEKDKRDRSLSSPGEFESEAEKAEVIETLISDDVFNTKPKLTISSPGNSGKVWAKDCVKAREEQKSKGRVRSKTSSES